MADTCTPDFITPVESVNRVRRLDSAGAGGYDAFDVPEPLNGKDAMP
jgi:hypothetical protein